MKFLNSPIDVSVLAHNIVLAANHYSPAVGGRNKIAGHKIIGQSSTLKLSSHD